MNKFSIKENELYPAHILIVDDDVSLGKMLVDFVSKCNGFDCFYCSSARAALQVLEERVFDVVITDIKMPDMSGIELTRIIRKKYDSGVIIITGFYEDFTYEQAIENGADDFIEKPVRPTELIMRLKRTLRERVNLSLLQRRIQELEHAENKCNLVQEKLHHQNEMLQSILNNIPVMVAFFDRKNHYQLINNCWQTTLGWSLEELRQHDDILAELYPDPKYREHVLEYIKRAKGSWGDFKTRTRSGHVLDTSWVNIALSDGSNIGIGIDISDRKRAETARRESEKKYRHIVETSIEGIWIINEEFRTTFVNKRLADMLGYTPEEILGKSVDSFLYEEDLEDYSARVTARRRGVGEVFERRLRRKDGTTLWNIVSSSAFFDGEGRFSGCFSMFTDITERKQAEEELKVALREKDVLLNEIHHRVKNNMQVISSLLKLQAKESKNPVLVESFNESQNRIHAMAMVHEKLYHSGDFSKIDLRDYTRSLSKQLFQSYKIHPNKIDLSIQTDGKIYLDIIKAIPCGLIMNELISNALKHAFPGDGSGELKIIIRETKSKEIEIVVRDNGLGLPDDVDIHETRSLGLTLVSDLAKNQLDGQIEVRRDKGTEFQITFPL